MFMLIRKNIKHPRRFCPNCVYYGMKGAVCISGLNVVSAKIAKKGDIKDFPKRARGLLCHNNMYIASLAIPVVAMIPALIINFSFSLLAIFILVLGLLLFRFFVLFTRIVCLHCQAKNICPNAQQMGLSNK